MGEDEVEDEDMRMRMKMRMRMRIRIRMSLRMRMRTMIKTVLTRPYFWSRSTAESGKECSCWCWAAETAAGVIGRD